MKTDLKMKVKNRFFVTLLLCLVMFAAKAHEVHYTYTHLRIDRVNDSVSAEITFKTEDLMEAMNLKMLYILEVKGNQLKDEDVRMLSGYIFSGFQLFVDSKPIDLKWVSGLFEEAGMRIKVRADLPQFKDANTVLIKNSLLNEIRGRNMVIFKMDNFEQGWLFDHKTTERQVDLTNIPIE